MKWRVIGSSSAAGLGTGKACRAQRRSRCCTGLSSCSDGALSYEQSLFRCTMRCSMWAVGLYAYGHTGMPISACWHHDANLQHGERLGDLSLQAIVRSDAAKTRLTDCNTS